jgi:hypothetical protein
LVCVFRPVFYRVALIYLFWMMGLLGRLVAIWLVLGVVPGAGGLPGGGWSRPAAGSWSWLVIYLAASGRAFNAICLARAGAGRDGPCRSGRRGLIGA